MPNNYQTNDTTQDGDGNSALAEAGSTSDAIAEPVIAGDEMSTESASMVELADQSRQTENCSKPISRVRAKETVSRENQKPNKSAILLMMLQQAALNLSASGVKVLADEGDSQTHGHLSRLLIIGARKCSACHWLMFDTCLNLDCSAFGHKIEITEHPKAQGGSNE